VSLPASQRACRWLADASVALEGYFTREDPRRLEPAEREGSVKAERDSGLRLRGFIDRLDMTPAGDIRIADYKAGKVPLMCLPEGGVLRYSPDEADLRATLVPARCAVPGVGGGPPLPRVV
jgi:putative RecB family exonuclease